MVLILRPSLRRFDILVAQLRVLLPLEPTETGSLACMTHRSSKLFYVDKNSTTFGVDILHPRE